MKFLNLTLLSTKQTLLPVILALLFSFNLTAQDVSIHVFVHNHHTYAPLDSAHVTILRDGIILDSSYTGKDGITRLTITPTGVEKMKPGLPNNFSISENYPNPFRDETQVDFSITESQTVRAVVYTILGQRVLSEELSLSAGYYSMKFPMSHLPTGIYFLRFPGVEQQTIKLMKIGGDVRYNTRLFSRVNIQVTQRSSISLPMQKISRQNGEYTIQVEKDRYELWTVTKQIESDTEIIAPLELLAEHLLTDIDGNVYQTVKIGAQWWMAENLRTTRYRNGHAISTGLDRTAWSNTTSGAYAIHPHDEVDGINSDEEMVDAYGKLYNWYAVDDHRGLCPEGWRVPTMGEWSPLINYLGDWEVAGGKLKSTYTEPDPHPRWSSPNKAATNESGFSGLPGGGGYSSIGRGGSWWSLTEYGTTNALYRYLSYELSGMYGTNSHKNSGRSVRCIKE